MESARKLKATNTLVCSITACVTAVTRLVTAVTGQLTSALTRSTRQNVPALIQIRCVPELKI